MKYSSVVVSGLPRAGGDLLARKLGEKLGWKVFSIGDLWRLKHKEKYPKNEISFEEFWRDIRKEEQSTMDLSARKIIEEGDVIGEFRFAKLADGLNCLFVFVTADLNVRAKRAKEMGKYGNLKEEEIANILKGREEDEVRMGKELYGQDYDYRDLSFYSMIIDSGELTLDEEVKVVEEMLKGKELKAILKELKL